MQEAPFRIRVPSASWHGAHWGQTHTQMVWGEEAVLVGTV